MNERRDRYLNLKLKVKIEGNSLGRVGHFKFCFKGKSLILILQIEVAVLMTQHVQFTACPNQTAHSKLPNSFKVISQIHAVSSCLFNAAQVDLSIPKVKTSHKFHLTSSPCTKLLLFFFLNWIFVLLVT